MSHNVSWTTMRRATQFCGKFFPHNNVVTPPKAACMTYFNPTILKLYYSMELEAYSYISYCYSGPTYLTDIRGVRHPVFVRDCLLHAANTFPTSTGYVTRSRTVKFVFILVLLNIDGACIVQRVLTGVCVFKSEFNSTPTPAFVRIRTTI